jgi:hypothetical protein
MYKVVDYIEFGRSYFRDINLPRLMSKRKIEATSNIIGLLIFGNIN